MADNTEVEAHVIPAPPNMWPVIGWVVKVNFHSNGHVSHFVVRIYDPKEYNSMKKRDRFGSDS